MPSFGSAIRASLHRTPHIIGVGECRDSDTLSACITASSLGITVNTTMPARSVADVLGHMVRMFPASEQASRACDLIRSLRVIMTQQLVSQPDYSGQLVVREFIVFNDEIRDRFASSHFDNWTRVTDRIFKDARNNQQLIAQSFTQAIETRIRKGLLTRDAAEQSSGSAFCQTR
jgi:defect-in-organelle-trafficking protein DotB